MVGGFVAVALFASACSSGGAVKKASLPDLADRTNRVARHFNETSLIAGRRLAIDGIVEDDYRYQATVLVDGSPVYSEVVADDARYVRVFSPELVVPDGRASELGALDPAYEAALSGNWVVDPKGAPGDFRSTTKQVAVPLNPSLVLGAVRFLEGTRELTARGTTEYNTDAINYLPKNDKFIKVKVANAKRYDVLPAGYDANQVTVTLGDLQKFFLWAAVWVDKQDNIVRIDKRIELPSPTSRGFGEVYRQIGRAGSDSLQTMLKLGDAGRLLTDSLSVRPDASVHIEVPISATPVAFGPAFLKAVPAFGPALQRAGPLTGPPT